MKLPYEKGSERYKITKQETTAWCDSQPCSSQNVYDREIFFRTYPNKILVTKYPPTAAESTIRLCIIDHLPMQYQHLSDKITFVVQPVWSRKKGANNAD